MRITWTLMLLIVSGAVAGCYKPNIAETLKCADASNHACPDGFACELGTNLCKRNPNNEGGVDRDAMSETVDAGPEGPPPGCFDARPNCQPDDSGICDPFCRTGCGCREKCSVNTGGELTCNGLAPLLLREVGQSCDRFNTGLSTQNDACDVGLVCLAGADDACDGRCYQFCRTHADCNNAPCDKTIAGGRTVCDVPFVTCNPVTPVSGCGSGAQGCYLSTTNPTQTICDCPGTVGANLPCNRSRDCFVGLVCVDPTNTLNFRCRQVCLLSEMGAKCPGGVGPDSCVPFRGSSTTMVNTTYGFCN